MENVPLFVEAIFATLGLIALAIFLRLARRGAAPAQIAPSAPSAEPGPVSAVRSVPAPDPKRNMTAQQRKEFDEAVAAGRLFADGRPRCSAGTCQEPATATAPAIKREGGVWDFVRTRFGAPQRYVLVPSVPVRKQDGPLDQAADLARAAWDGGDAGAPRARARYCATHCHVANEVALEKLAELEYEHASFQAQRETRLATFEASGLEAEVRRRVGDEEIEAEAEREAAAAASPAASLRGAKRKRPSSAPNGAAVVVPMRRRIASPGAAQ